MYSVEETNYLLSIVNNRTESPSSALRFPNSINACPAVPAAASQAQIDNIATLLSKTSISKPKGSSLPGLSSQAKLLASARTQLRRDNIVAKLGLPSKGQSKRPAEVAAPVQPAPTSTPATTESGGEQVIVRPSRIPVPSRPAMVSAPPTPPTPVSIPPIPSMPSQASLLRQPSRIPSFLPPLPSLRPVASSQLQPHHLRTLLPSRLRPTPPRSCLKGSRSASATAVSFPSAVPYSAPFAQFPASQCLKSRCTRGRRFIFLSTRPDLDPHGGPSYIPSEPLKHRRGTKAYCPAHWWADDTGVNYSPGTPGRGCDCHGPAQEQPNNYIPPTAWGSTPAEADEVNPDRPRQVTWSEDVAFDFFQRWYMEAYDVADDSTDTSSEEDDALIIREMDAEAQTTEANAPVQIPPASDVQSDIDAGLQTAEAVAPVQTPPAVQIPPAPDFLSTWQALMDEGFEDDED